MPRGRRSVRGTATAPQTPEASPDVPHGRTRAQTRSSSSRVTGLPMPGGSDQPLDTVPNHSEGGQLNSGKPTRSSQAPKAAEDTVPAGSAGAPPVSQQRPRGRPRKEAVAGSSSVSSVASPAGASSASELSTPATSKVPTPVSVDPAKPASLEVRIPAKPGQAPDESVTALRDSLLPLNNMVMDSDEEDYSDQSPSAITARRLQKEELLSAAGHMGRRPGFDTEKLDFIAGSGSSKSSRNKGKAPKRALSSAGPSSPRTSSAKKARMAAASDRAGFDLDAEIAAAAALDSDALSDPPASEDDSSGDSLDSFINDAKESGDNSSDSSDSDSEGEPLRRGRAGRNSRAKYVGKGKAPMVRQAQSDPPTTATHRITAGSFTKEVIGSEGSLSLMSESELSSDSEVGAVIIIGDDEEDDDDDDDDDDDEELMDVDGEVRRLATQRRGFRRNGNKRRSRIERERLVQHHPELLTMWKNLARMPVLAAGIAQQPQSISRQLKPFQLEGLAWMKEMEELEWKGGLLGDEMGLGKTIQAVSLIMSDYPAKQPSLVLVPPVALMQWQSEIKSYTDGTLKTFVYHGTNQKSKNITVKELRKFDVIMMSYNSLESMYRKQERGFKRKNGLCKEKSVIHAIHFHRIILDEAHCIKTRTTMTAKACFALQTDFRWCLTGTPLQNRIGEFFSLLRFLNVRPFASYLCKQCPCSSLSWSMNEKSRCVECGHPGMQHVSVFNQELLNPIQKFGNYGPGREAFRKLRLLTERIMLRRLKKDHTNSMELPVKEIYVDRQFFGEEENDFANSIMTSGQRRFDTYVAQGVLLNNYANIFGLIMQMRQVADHPDLILKKNAEGGQNVLVCCICDEPAEDTVRSRCKHDFCRACVSSYVMSTDTPDCPRCHISLSVDLEQPEIAQDESMLKKSSIINRIKMEQWTSSSKIELLVHELHKLRSDNASHKSIIFSQFTTMLQLIEWRLRRAGITTVMLDGSMTPAQRQASIEHFMNNVDVECFLVSLKAGGVALNLTEASRVFIVDPWWNPAAEWQSADRCHRIGQTRPCTITRLCIEDSVESRMVLIQEKKASMIHSTVNADDKAMESLTPEDMQFLFRGS